MSETIFCVCCDSREDKSKCTTVCNSCLDLSFRAKARWISVKERLPLYKEVVLVFLDTQQITEAVYRGEYDKNEHIFRIELTGEDTGERVTHWIPLPEKPE